jgi:Fe2+ transport system protein FeoA
MISFPKLVAALLVVGSVLASVEKKNEQAKENLEQPDRSNHWETVLNLGTQGPSITPQDLQRELQGHSASQNESGWTEFSFPNINKVDTTLVGANSEQEFMIESYSATVANLETPEARSKEKGKEKIGENSDQAVPAGNTDETQTPGLVGIVNRQNYCYMSSLFQVLYHLPSVREMMVTHQSASIVQVILASFFYRLTVSNKPQDIDVDLFQSIKNLLRGSEGTVFAPGRQDDVHAFWMWLMDVHLPWIARELFTVKTANWLSYEGLEWNYSERAENGIVATILEGDIQAQLIGQSIVNEQNIIVPPVHAWLGDSEESLDGYRFNEKDMTGTFVKEDIKREGPDMRERLLALGVKPGDEIKAIRHTKTVETPPILVISASKFVYDPSAANAETWKFNIQTRHESTIKVGEKEYHLHAVIVHTPNHYYTHACTNVTTNAWHTFNDHVVTPFEYTGKADVFGKNPYLFFYVEDSLRSQWSTVSFDANGIPQDYQLLGQLSQSMHDTKRTLELLTGRASSQFEVPGISIPQTPRDLNVRKMIREEL